jgi:peptidyl-prolyl cis-trans isomerase C
VSPEELPAFTTGNHVGPVREPAQLNGLAQHHKGEFLMKTTLKLWIVATAIMMMAIPLPALAEEAAPSSDARAAVVNGTVISMADVDKEIENFQKQFEQMGQTVDDAKLLDMKKNILGRMIDMELLFQESQKKGFTIDEDAAKQEMANIKQRFPNEDEFKKQIALSGRSEEDLLKDIMRGKAIEKLVEKEVGEKIVVSDEDVKKYYDDNPNFFKQPEQVRASHILIKVEPTAEEAEKAAAQLRIGEIKQKLDEGGDFAELAKEFSEGPSGPRGGDLNYFGRGQMVPPFEEAAFALEVGQVSDVVETRFGYHLIKVSDKKEGTATPFDEIKEKIQQFLKSQKMNEEVGNYIGVLKEKAAVESFL